jgi:hypothetical protein
MSGVIQLGDSEDLNILVFKNDYKEENRHPDYQIYEAPDREQEQNNDDDIPF